MTDATHKTDLTAVGRRIVRAMLVIFFYYAWLKFGGLLMNLLIVNYFNKAEAIYNAYTSVYGVLLYTLLFSSALKVLLPSFMPLFSQTRAKENEQAAWDTASTILNLVLMATAVVTALSLAFTPQVIDTLLPNFTEASRAGAIRLLQWMLPGALALSFATMAQGILNSYKVFSYPSAGEAAQKLSWVATLLVGIAVFRPAEAGMAPYDVIGASFLVGSAVQTGILLFGLRKHLRFYRLGFPALSTRRLLTECGWMAAAAAFVAGACWWISGNRDLSAADRGYRILTACLVGGGAYSLLLWYRSSRGRSTMARFAMLAAPLLASTFVARYRDLSASLFQSGTRGGAYSLIELAKKVINLPAMLISISLGVAMLPYLCDIAAKRDIKGIGRVSGRALKIIMLFFVPLTAVTIILSLPIMQVLGDTGNWDEVKAYQAGVALALLASAIIFMGAENVLMQTFFSMQRTALPSAVGVVFSLVPSFGLYLVVERMGYNSPYQSLLAVCIAYSGARALKNIVLFAFLQKQIRMFSWREGLAFGGKLILISAAVAGVAWFAYRPMLAHVPVTALGAGKLQFKLAKCLHLAVPSAAALAVFLAGCVLLRVEEFQIVVQWVKDKGWKHQPEKPHEA